MFMDTNFLCLWKGMGILVSNEKELPTIQISDIRISSLFSNVKQNYCSSDHIFNWKSEDNGLVHKMKKKSSKAYLYCFKFLITTRHFQIVQDTISNCLHIQPPSIFLKKITQLCFLLLH